jgi:hypothetical protein
VERSRHDERIEVASQIPEKEKVVSASFGKAFSWLRISLESVYCPQRAQRSGSDQKCAVCLTGKTPYVTVEITSSSYFSVSLLQNGQNSA